MSCLCREWHPYRNAYHRNPYEDYSIMAIHGKAHMIIAILITCNTTYNLVVKFVHEARNLMAYFGANGITCVSILANVFHVYHFDELFVISDFRRDTVCPTKYAHGSHYDKFLLWISITRFLPSFRIASLAQGQSYDCPCASEAILQNMGKQTTYTQQTSRRDSFDIVTNKTWYKHNTTIQN